MRRTARPDHSLRRRLIDGPVTRFHDRGDVYAIRNLPVRFTPGRRTTA